MVEGQLYTINYVTNGVFTSFDYPFFLWEFSDLIVQWQDQLLNPPITLQLDVDYTLSGVADAFGTYPDGVSIVISNPPLATGNLYVSRYTQRTQLSTWVDNDPFPAVQQERALDKLTLMIQELAQNFMGFLAGPPTGIIPPIGSWFIVYPAIAGTFFGWIYTTTGWKQFAPISF